MDEPYIKGVNLLAKFEKVIRALDGDDLNNDKWARHQEEHFVCWETPPEGWVVLNTDGAAKGIPCPVGAGGILRGEKGKWLKGFSENLGSCSSVKAELKATLRGLRMARAWNIHRLRVQLDSCLLYTSPSPRDGLLSRMPSSA